MFNIVFREHTKHSKSLSTSVRKNVKIFRMLRKKLKINDGNKSEPTGADSNLSRFFQVRKSPTEPWRKQTSNEIDSRDIAAKYIESELNFSKELSDWAHTLKHKDIQHVYNPLVYAFKPHEEYVRKYANSTKDVLFIGMNPGPYGMCQTGVPFGEVNAAKNWLMMKDRTVGKPENECPNQRVLGFDCQRSEVSGKRFWGLFQELCGDSQRFFESGLVVNYCPLAFLTSGGRNVTLPEIRVCIRF